MRVWDVHPGYLNRQSLLGEHCELHGIVSILSLDKRGNSNHPETKRWKGRGWAIRQRHCLLAAEMAFRGYRDRTPVRGRSAAGQWPDSFIDTPGRQFALLADTYRGKEPGRIPLPRTSHELWSHHKYSVMARSQAAYRELGRRVSGLRGRVGFDALALELVNWLRQPPSPGDMRNAVQHMRGYVDAGECLADDDGPGDERIEVVQRHVATAGRSFLTTQTALTDLAAWPPLG
ncbi:MAG: DUF1722 domain-containing protein [Gammaproteobacteria bacterium]|nr:DUF1722 domain-containing protein [Gammaproteobacteria bacterium]